VKAANVVICVMDAARADHFGAYGYPRDTTPNFDRLARDAVVFDQHFCQYPQTSPSTATLFTGEYPDTHGVAVPRTSERHEMLRAVEPGAFTLDWAMRSTGFRTLLFTSTPASAGVLRLGASFEVLFTPMGAVRSKEEDALWKSPEQLMELVRGNLTARPRFYAYVHFLPPHEPYDAPQTIKDLYAGKQAPDYFHAAPAFTRVYGRFYDHDPPAIGSDWVNLYDANLHWSDVALGELVSYLKQIDAYDNTLLIVTADHGEALGEHRYQWHATCPYDEAIHIPLLMKFPKSRPAAGRVQSLTETIDVMPTLLDLLGIPAPPGTVQGASLVPLLTGATEKVHDYIFCRTNGQWPCYVVRSREWSLLLYQGGGMRALYDLTADARQTHNVIDEHPEEAKALAKVFAQFAEKQAFRPLDFLDPSFTPLTSPSASTMAIPEEARQKLRSLGYLE
jgi:arylsulfatase